MKVENLCRHTVHDGEKRERRDIEYPLATRRGEGKKKNTVQPCASFFDPSEEKREKKGGKRGKEYLAFDHCPVEMRGGKKHVSCNIPTLLIARLSASRRGKGGKKRERREKGEGGGCLRVGEPCGAMTGPLRRKRKTGRLLSSNLCWPTRWGKEKRERGGGGKRGLCCVDRTFSRKSRRKT